LLRLVLLLLLLLLLILLLLLRLLVLILLLVLTLLLILLLLVLVLLILILLLILFLLLLLLLFLEALLQLLELARHELVVELGIGVLGVAHHAAFVARQRFLVALDRRLRIARFGVRSETVFGVAHVVVGEGHPLGIAAGRGLGQGCDRLVVLALL